MTDQTTPPEQPQTTATPPVQEGALRFTQDEFDKVVGDRAKRAAEAAVAKLLADLGYEKPDDLKRDTTEYRKKRDDEKTEAQKAQDDADQARKERDELKATLDNERKQRVIDRRNAAIESAATKARADVPRDVLVWAREYVPTELEATVGDDGTVDEKAVNAIIDKCKEARKGWFTGNAPGSPSNNDGRVPQPDMDAVLKGVKLPRI